MKPKLFILSIALFFGVAIFAGCQKTAPTIKDSKDVKITKLALLHNEYLENIISHYDFDSNESKILKFKQAFLKSDLKGISYQQKEKILRSYYHKSFKNSQDSAIKIVNSNDLINKINSSKLSNKKLLIESIALATKEAKMNNMSCSKLNDFVDSLETALSLHLGGDELVILKTYGETLKASAYFWFPKSVGGSGKGYSFLLKVQNTSSSKSKSMKDVNFELPPLGAALVADAASMSIGMVGVAISGAFLGPVGWGALVLVAGESAVNSGFSGLVTAG